ncbi:Bacterial alpha-L-rhamnosidase [Schleiferilactobacillus harbinensis]|uniref:family 78 glycoside hydrolase catalytic domain n=1 Tax=Schleiferilactobacillus harbinensis TaxID=304207 RepID=UPI00123934C4|nr:family 78 glycoside hydrolase catalytic domain [Schleiferilactobacillus harbinensis]QEU47507.1 Bacterial alpha-L-rhamnosidase [Schleiferilactobacillus harbinensis]
MVLQAVLRVNNETDFTFTARPQFSWQLFGGEKGLHQQHYLLEVAADPDFYHILWQIERNGAQSFGVSMPAVQLQPTAEYYARVQVRTNQGTTDWSAPVRWADPRTTWQAGWIRPVKTQIGGPKKQKRPYTAQKEFTIQHPGQRAILRLSALGMYHAQLNGQDVGRDYFRPGFTDYSQRVQYQSYDVTALLQRTNTLRIEVTEGWYSGLYGWWGGHDLFGNTNAVIAQLEIDGQVVVGTDASWTQWYGPRQYADLYNGEEYDGQSDWQPVGQMVPFPYSKAVLVPQEGPSVRVLKKITPQRLFHDPAGHLVLDLGQNIAGWIAFKNQHVVADTVTLTHGEVLDQQGNFFRDNIRAAAAEDIYHLPLNDGQTYQPRFTYHGFRYVQLTGFADDVPVTDFTGVAISSLHRQTGTFTTDNAAINQLQSNILWGQRDNFVEIPTDCPQRDERAGWTADAQVFMPTANLNYDTQHFVKRWLRDFLPAQQAQDGALPVVIPDILRGGFNGTTGVWGDAAVLIPWYIYRTYGDIQVLRDQYTSMQAWVNYVRRRGTEEGLYNTGAQLGDWLALDTPAGSYHGGTDQNFVATAFFAWSTAVLAKTAWLLGKVADAHDYEQLHTSIVAAFRRTYLAGVTPKKDTQTANVLLLQCQLVEKGERPAVAQHLADLIQKNGGHLDTGFAGAPYLCPVLSANGQTKAAYDLLFQESYPSWLYEVQQGATTMWEHWDSLKPDGSFWSSDMNSFNHYAYGSIGQWLYETVAGLHAQRPGYQRSVIAPQPDARFGHVQAEINTVFGPLVSDWYLRDGQFTLTVTIPANTTAQVVLPNGAGQEAMVLAATAQSAQFTDGTLRRRTIDSFGVKFQEAIPADAELWPVAAADLGFLLGSGTYTFHYAV